MNHVLRDYYNVRRVTAVMLLLLFLCPAGAQEETCIGGLCVGNMSRCKACAGEDSVGKDINVVMLGDSNTSIGGDACDIPRGWNKWFRDVFRPASCRSYARSGATWTNTAVTKYNIKEYTELLGNDNVVYNQINRLVDAYKAGEQPVPQLIIIAAGTNDAWFTKARPAVFAKTAAQAFARQDGFMTDVPVNKVVTLAESVRYGCEMLMETFPEARIVLLTPLQSVAAGAENIRRAGDLIEECGRYMSLKVIRQDHGSGIYAAREKVKRRYTSDGTHTNEEGARRCGEYIAHEIGVLYR